MLLHSVSWAEAIKHHHGQITSNMTHLREKRSNCPVTLKNRWIQDKKSVKIIPHLSDFYHRFSTSCMTKKYTMVEKQPEVSHLNQFSQKPADFWR